AFHKFHLMLMDILHGKGIRVTLFGVKTDGNPLYHTDIVHRTLFLKVSQCDMPTVFIKTDRGDGGGHFLNERQLFIPVLLICVVYHFFENGAPKPPGCPCCHFCFYSCLFCSAAPSVSSLTDCRLSGAARRPPWPCKSLPAAGR